MGISRTVFLAFTSCILASPAFAAISDLQVSGASAFVQEEEKPPRILAGYVEGASCTASPCNSCDGQAGTHGFKACNRNGILPTGTLTIQGRTSTSDLGTTIYPVLKQSDGTTSISNVTAVAPAGGVFSVSVAWSDLCSSLGSSGCTADISESLIFGLSTTTSGTPAESERIELKLILSHVNNTVDTVGSDNFFTECVWPDIPGAVGDGFCEMHAFPGDGKMYALDLTLGGSSLAASTTKSDILWNGIVIFYEEVINAENALATLARITNASPSSEVTYDNTQNPPNVDNRTMGLENGVDYCFLLANRDETGNIFKAAPHWNYDLSEAESYFCKTPQPVVGLLDDKKCFVATAAFGSPFEPQVQALREFRDRYLKTNSAGRAFVDFYYASSPAFADFIRGNETLKAVTRVALWPAVVVAEASLAWGPMVILGLMVSLGGGLAVLWRRRRRNS